MSGIDPQIPITMLPVRIETRFAGTLASPRLQVRLYPDDVHVDRHDPRLTSREVAAGKRYWTSVRAGTAGDQAWAQLLKDVGPTRAIWARQALTPTNASGAPTFPDVATVDGNAGIAATARALPGSFIVRVRYAGGQKIVQGSAIPASLQVGISFGTAPPGTTPAAPPVGRRRDARSRRTHALDGRFRRGGGRRHGRHGRSAAADEFRAGRDGRRSSGRRCGWRCGNRSAHRVAPAE